MFKTKVSQSNWEFIEPALKERKLCFKRQGNQVETELCAVKEYIDYLVRVLQGEDVLNLPKWKPGTMVTAKDKTPYPRSTYEVLADNGTCLVLLFRELCGHVTEDSKTVCIRLKDKFEKIQAPHLMPTKFNLMKIDSLGVQYSVKKDVIEWLKKYDKFVIVKENKSECKDRYFDLVESGDGGDRYLEFAHKYEKEIA